MDSLHCFNFTKVILLAIASHRDHIVKFLKKDFICYLRPVDLLEMKYLSLQQVTKPIILFFFLLIGAVLLFREESISPKRELQKVFSQVNSTHSFQTPLRKHAYSNIPKILPPKTENFQIKNLIFFKFLLKT